MGIKITDAFSRWSYEKTPEGLARVIDDQGNTGLFRADGSWVSGEVTHASLHIIGYLCGPHAQRDPNRPDPGTRFARNSD